MSRRVLIAPLVSAVVVAAAGAALAPLSAAASAELVGVVTDGGLHTVEYRVPEGTIRVLLPDDLAAGDTISGTVVAEPAGETEQERESRRTALAGYTVDIGGEAVAAGSHGRWQVAAGAAALPVLLRDAAGAASARGEVPVLAGVPAATGFDVPEIAQAGDPLAIRGPFDGDAGTTAVTLAGAAAEVLAESPRRIVVATPAATVGPTEVTVTEGDARAGGTVRLVSVGLSAGDLSLQRGEQTTMKVTVGGLEGIEEPIPLTVTNLTPAVVRLEGPPVILVEPSEVGPGGTYSRDWTLSGVVPGGFSIRARVTPPEPEPMLPVAPGSGTTAGPRPSFEWRPLPLPGAVYELTLSRLLDEAGDPMTGPAPPPEGTTELEPVLRADDLTEPLYDYPAQAPPLEPGLYVWRVLTIFPDGPLDAPAGDSGPIPIRVDSCRCQESGSNLVATLTRGGTRLRTVELESNPSTTRLPPGPIAVAFTGGNLGCKECDGERCAATGVVLAPASATLTPTADLQTLEVAATWNCTRTGCQPDSCAKTLKLKYRLAGRDCLCGEILATATVVNETPGRESSATGPLVCHRGVSEPAIVDLREEIELAEGDRLTVRLASFAVACWCRDGLCTSQAAEESDQDDGRPVTVELGENDSDSNSDNSNLTRLAGGGWQADGGYEIEVGITDDNTTDRGVYQDVALRAKCDSDPCGLSSCRCSWRLGLGGL